MSDNFDSTDTGDNSDIEATDVGDDNDVSDVSVTNVSDENAITEISIINEEDFVEENISVLDSKDANITISTTETLDVSDNSSKEFFEVNEATNSKSVEITEDIVNNTFSIIGKMENLSPEEKVEKMQMIYTQLSAEAKREVTVPARVEFLDEKTPFDRYGKPNYKWEGKMGFEGPPKQTSLKEGMTLDRYGSNKGNYVCEVKNGVPQEYNSRALPYLENPEMYHQYEVVRNMDDIAQRIENLSIEEIEQIEIQRNMDKPEEEKLTDEQIKAVAQDRYINIQFDVQTSINRANQMAKDNGWDVNYYEIAPLQGKIKESFAYVDENGQEVKMGGGEQIVLPASIDTLMYLGYLEEKHG